MTSSLSSIQVRITSRSIEAVDIVGLELASLDGSPLPSFSAGSHVDIRVGSYVRQYSLCNDPHETHRYQIAVLRDPASRGGSIAVHETLKVGDVVEISTPKNHFPLVPAKRTLLFAGGIGITPILCMAERLQQAGDEFELHYCGRTRERLAFLSRISDSPFANRCVVHLDDGAADQKLNASQLLQSQGEGAHAYVCGPKGFIDHIVQTARTVGWADDHVHVEHFGAAPIDTAGDAEFDVKIASSGAVLRIPADKSISKVLEENGIDIPVSCEQGVCGTCLTRVLAGAPDHRDLFLTDAERACNDQFTPCCSRSKSPMLVLDL